MAKKSTFPETLLRRPRSMKVFDDEWKQWQHAARRNRISLTQWARIHLNRAAKRANVGD